MHGVDSGKSTIYLDGETPRVIYIYKRTNRVNSNDNYVAPNNWQLAVVVGSGRL